MKKIFTFIVPLIFCYEVLAQDIIISEIMYDSESAPDQEWIELYNNTDATIDISGYYMTDDDSYPADAEGDFVIPATTTIAARSFLVIAWEDLTGITGELIVDPSLSGNTTDNPNLANGPNGDQIALYTSLTGGTLVDGTTTGNYPDKPSSSTNSGYSIERNLNAITPFASGDSWTPSSNVYSGSEHIRCTPGTTNSNQSVAIVWDGSESSDWTENDNWAGGTAPTENDYVQIEAGGFDPVIEAGEIGACDDLLIATGATLTVESGGIMAIYGSVQNDGTYTVERNTQGNSGYSMLGSPINNTPLAQLSADFVFEYDEGSGTYSEVTGGSLDRAKGYFVSYTEPTPVTSVTGTPNFGNVQTTLTATNASADYYNLLANPYSAPIAFADYVSSAGDTNGTIWIWDDGGSNSGGDRTGGYLTVSNAGSVSAVGGTTGNTWNGYIGAFQGFFVLANSGGGNYRFQSSMQSTDVSSNDDGNYFRKSSEMQKVKLSINGENNAYDELLIVFAEGVTFGQDFSYDAPKLSSGAVAFYSILEDEPFAIQALPYASNEPIEVDLGLNIDLEGSYRLNVESLENIPEYLRISIRDNSLNETYDLSEIKQIDFSSPATIDSRKYTLVASIKEEVLNVADNLKDWGLQIQESKALLTSQTTGLRDVHIITLEGKSLYKDQHSFTAGVPLEIPLLLNQNQLYILRLDNQTTKFLIK